MSFQRKLPISKYGPRDLNIVVLIDMQIVSYRCFLKVRELSSTSSASLDPAWPSHSNTDSPFHETRLIVFKVSIIPISEQQHQLFNIKKSCTYVYVLVIKLITKINMCDCVCFSCLTFAILIDCMRQKLVLAKSWQNKWSNSQISCS